MKVVHLTSAHPAFDSRIFQRECKSLVRMGWEVVLIAPHERDETVDGVQVRAVPRVASRLRRMTISTAAVLWHCLHEKAEIYHFHDPELIPLGLLLRLMGRRVVYDIHEDLPRTIDSKGYVRPWLRRPLKRITESVEDYASRWFSALVVATPKIAQRFSQINLHTIVICNFPVLEDTPQPEVRWNERRAAIAYVGNITLERGIREILKAINLLSAETPFSMVLAGKCWPDSLHEELVNLPGWSRVDYLGYIQPKQIPSLLCRMRAGIVVLHPTENYIHSMPIKLFEYMAAGIPVIASDFPLWREIIDNEHCGVLVNPSSPEEIAHAIQLLLSCPQQAQEMGARGRTAVEAKYNWKSQERRLYSLYQALNSSGAN